MCLVSWVLHKVWTLTYLFLMSKQRIFPYFFSKANVYFIFELYVCLSVSPCVYLYTWEQTSHSRKNSVRFLCLEVQVAVKPNFFCKIAVFCKNTLNHWAIFPTCVSPIWSLLSISFTVLKLRFSTFGFIFWFSGVLFRMLLHVSVIEVVFLPFS